MATVLIRNNRALIRNNRVLIGPACRVSRMTVRGLGFMDDDLRVDIGGRIVSDTKLNVSAYYEDEIGPGGQLGFNPLWQTEGFRKIVLEYPNAGTAGEAVKIWLTDVGSAARAAGPVEVKLEYPNGVVDVRQFPGTATIVSPNWPPGTEGPPSEMAKPHTQRPVAFPGSPPIYVPLGEFIIPWRCNEEPPSGCSLDDDELQALMDEDPIDEVRTSFTQDVDEEETSITTMCRRLVVWCGNNAPVVIGNNGGSVRLTDAGYIALAETYKGTVPPGGKVAIALIFQGVRPKTAKGVPSPTTGSTTDYDVYRKEFS